MKLSIIICVYNTPKKYLEECLRSITSSTVKVLGEDYEICMVDDGSSMDYSELIDRFGLRVQKTENRGIYSARRSGAIMARGEYAIYCDSDDTVSFNYYLPMLKKAEESGADIVINDWANLTERARFFAKKDDTVCTDIDVSGDDTLLCFLKGEGKQHSFYVLWNKLYRRELLLSAFDRLSESGFDKSCSFSEDAALNFFLWKDAKRVVNMHTGYYFYRIHPSQTVNAASAEKLKKQIDSMADTLRIMRENLGEHRERDRLLGYIDKWSALMSRAHYSQARGGGHTELFDHIKEKYGVDKLSLSNLEDGKYYEKKGLLGDNFAEVDRALLEIHDSGKPVRVKYSKRDLYTQRSVEYLDSMGKITQSKEAKEITIPKFKIKKRNKFIHNPLVYRLGLIFFKKGSRARNFLKKHM